MLTGVGTGRGGTVITPQVGGYAVDSKAEWGLITL
jgi:hypothetical protein